MNMSLNQYESLKKQKKQSLESLGSSRAWRSPNFFGGIFFGTVQHFCLFSLKKIVFLDSTAFLLFWA